MSKENLNNNINTDNNNENEKLNFTTACKSKENNSNDQQFKSDFKNNTKEFSEQTKREETPFSLKHFLKKDTNIVPSSTTTTAPATNATTQDETYGQQHKMTGARPKVPINNGCGTTGESVKMKRSPKFSSFDSQASLAEFSSNRHLSNDTLSMTNVYLSESSSSDSNQNFRDKAYFQRSYSTYDMGRKNNNSSLTNASNTNEQPYFPFDQPLFDQSSPYRDSAPTVEISSALPDFVQDHIFENFYKNYSPTSSTTLSDKYEQLPDFTLNENDVNSRLQMNNGGDMPFDLMCNSSESSRMVGSDRRSNPPLILPLDLANNPLDLPNNCGGDAMASHNRSTVQPSLNDIPLDLTARSDHYDNRTIHHHHHHPTSESGAFQTLPDFLSDGHIHSTSAASVRQQPDINNIESSPKLQQQHHSHHAQQESVNSSVTNRGLIRDLERSNQIISEQSLRIIELESTIHSMRNNERDNLAQSLREEPQLMTNNVSTAPEEVIELRKQILALKEEVDTLRQENEILKEEGAVGGAAASTGPTTMPLPLLAVQTQELSKDMMLAASTAENNLRQLLSGVENLRLMARRIEYLGGAAAEDSPRDDYSEYEYEEYSNRPDL